MTDISETPNIDQAELKGFWNAQQVENFSLDQPEEVRVCLIKLSLTQNIVTNVWVLPRLVSA